MNARDWTLAEINRRIALCREATPGPWQAVTETTPDGTWMQRPRTSHKVQVGESENVAICDSPGTIAHVAASSPSALLPLYEWMRGEVERHEYVPVGPSGVLFDCTAGCPRIHLGLATDCPFVAGLASALGYPGSGEGCEDAEAIAAQCRSNGHNCEARLVQPAAPVQSGGGCAVSKPLLLDAFSCAGIGADGYARHFDVVCLDNDPKALRHNPHPTVCGDALELLADAGFMAQFAAVHFSSPCQGYSATRCLAVAQGKGPGRGAVDLLHPTRDLLARYDLPWIAENVTRSPVRSWPGAVRLCGSAFGLKVERHRWFAPSPGLALTGVVCDHDAAFDRDPTTGKPRPWGVYYAKGDSIPSGGRTALSDEHGHEVMGVTERRVPWRYLCEALPPAYTDYLGAQLRAHLCTGAAGGSAPVQSGGAP